MSQIVRKMKQKHNALQTSLHGTSSFNQNGTNNILSQNAKKMKQNHSVLQTSLYRTSSFNQNGTKKSQTENIPNKEQPYTSFCCGNSSLLPYLCDACLLGGFCVLDISGVVVCIFFWRQNKTRESANTYQKILFLNMTLLCSYPLKMSINANKRDHSTAS